MPDRGWASAVSLWIDGAPDNISLADCAVCFGDREQLGCYVSPVSANGGCQLNAYLLEGTAPGECKVQLNFAGQLVERAHPIRVFAAPPYAPRVISVADGTNLRSRNRVETGGLKVIISDVGRPAEVSFTLAGRAVECNEYECVDPIRSTFEFACTLASDVPPGVHYLVVRAEGRQLEPIALELVS
jgi:hypothetical protein